MIRHGRMGWRAAALLAVLLTVSATPAWPAAPDLYSATAPVSQEGAQGRNQAIADALVIVLQKLSGRRDIVGRTGLQELLDAAPGFVQQFRFQQGAGGARRLWVRFDRSAVERGLQGLGLPIWDASRPRTLVWVAIDRDGRRAVFNPESDPALLAVLRQQADARGLPLVLPLMDLEDQTKLNVGDLWNAFETPVRAASARYRHDGILLGRLRQLGRDSWSGTWTLLLPEADPMQFDSGRGDLAQVAGSGIDLAVDRMAARFAPVDAGDGPSRLALRIGGVQDLPDYAEVLQALQGQQAIQRLVVRYAAGDQLQVDIWVKGGLENLRRSLTLDSRFVPDLTTPPVSASAPVVPPTGDPGAAVDSGTNAPPATPTEPDFDIAYRWVG